MSLMCRRNGPPRKKPAGMLFDLEHEETAASPPRPLPRATDNTSGSSLAGWLVPVACFRRAETARRSYPAFGRFNPQIATALHEQGGKLTSAALAVKDAAAFLPSAGSVGGDST